LFSAGRLHTAQRVTPSFTSAVAAAVCSVRQPAETPAVCTKRGRGLGTGLAPTMSGRDRQILAVRRSPASNVPHQFRKSRVFVKPLRDLQPELTLQRHRLTFRHRRTRQLATLRSSWLGSEPRAAPSSKSVRPVGLRSDLAAPASPGTDAFFEQLDRQLGPNGGPDGQPSATDFLVIELPAAVSGSRLASTICRKSSTGSTAGEC
jgi:hypothetical protein